MSTITVNGARVASGTITFPFYGAWVADLALNDGTVLPTTAKGITLVVGDLTLVGTVVRQATFVGSTSARIVAGAGGWREEIPAKGYSHTAGVKLSSVLNDAAREAGETISIATDRVLGAHYARDKGKAEHVLNWLLGSQWWVDADGATQTATRDASAIASPFTIIGWSGPKGQFEIASESVAPWQPGRTFSNTTVTTIQTISSVTIEASNEGKLRMHVLNTDGAVERIRADLRALVRAESMANHANVWEYVITSATSTTVDAKPTDSRMPAITKCPMMPGLIGEVVTPASGSTCRIVFVNGDPSRPECIGIDGSPTLAVIAAGVQGVARMLDTVQAGPFAGTITSGSTKVRVG